MFRVYQWVNADKDMILSFISVGAITAVINYLLFSFFWGLLHLHYLIAVSIAFILAIVFHFIANRYYTFKIRDNNFQEQLFRYLGLITINYLLTLAVMHIVVEQIKLSPYLGNILAIGVTVCSGYLMARLWVFARD